MPTHTPTWTATSTITPTPTDTSTGTVQPTYTPTFTPTNIGRVRIWGAEVELAAELPHDLEAVVSYTLTDAEYCEFDPDDSVEGNRLTEIPPELAEHETLTELVLDDNRIAELPPFGLRRRLATLSCARNPVARRPDPRAARHERDTHEHA